MSNPKRGDILFRRATPYKHGIAQWDVTQEGCDAGYRNEMLGEGFWDIEPSDFRSSREEAIWLAEKLGGIIYEPPNPKRGD